ncbi:hypothetical protein [Actinocorallia libanotica]|uniref:DUF222 domain-containing protein n=1 Tax=Actinocorallia libanotica TaxID=46162 RepID=A0ABN1RFK9_9ACTN
MAATFGDLLAVADAHWVEAMEWLETPELSWQAGDRSTTGELGQAALVLARYAERIGTGFSAQGRGTPVARKAQLCAASLRDAASALHENGEPPSERCELARSLFMARQALGCGLDLLTAHFEVEEGRLRPVTVQSKVISSTSSVEWLLTTVDGYVGQLLRIAEKSGKADAAAELSEAVRHAKRRGNPEEQGLRATTMPAIRTTPTVGLDGRESLLPERVPLKEGETRERALAGIQANVQWLRASDAPQSARTWRSLATSTLMTSEISGQILRLLMERCRQLEWPETRHALAEAEAAVGELNDKWADVTFLWREVVCDRKAQLDQMTVDAGELVVRMGRLAYADRRWRPSANAVTRLVRPQILAPQSVDVRVVALAVEDALKVPRAVASRALEGLTSGRMTGLNRRGETQMKQRHERLSLRYLQARNAAGKAQDALAEAMRSLSPPGERRPGRLASESFPFSSREALGAAQPKASERRSARQEQGARLTLG